MEEVEEEKVSESTLAEWPRLLRDFQSATNTVNAPPPLLEYDEAVEEGEEEAPAEEEAPQEEAPQEE